MGEQPFEGNPASTSPGKYDSETHTETDIDLGHKVDASEFEVHTIDKAESDIVEMHVSVDVSEMDKRNKAVLVELAGIFEDNFKELINKNRDYGFSFLRTGSKLAASEAFPVDSASRAQALGLLTRAGDKRERLIENVFGDGSDAVSDPAHVTAREAANYWLFLSLVLKDPTALDDIGVDGV
jgi:hypothetical protein